jgi:threonine synthase
VVVLVPKGKIAVGKFAQVIAYGASILTIGGNFDQALKIVLKLVEKHPITLVNSLNPFRIEGQKTGAFEIIDELGGAPDYHFIPVGNAGNITAYWKGYTEYKKLGKASKLPVMMGFQAAGAAPIVKNKVVEKPKTFATAIRIGNPASWKMAVAARDESGGVIDSVTDAEILNAYKLMASKEGVFGEPASAAPLAGILKMLKKGLSLKNKKVVCIVTGNGLKDPGVPVKYAEPFPELEPEIGVIEKFLGW